jgi:hypothetical protein
MREETAAQLLVHQRQQLRRSLFVAIGDGLELHGRGMILSINHEKTRNCARGFEARFRIDL